MEKFWRWMDSRHFISVRALTLYITLWMTWKAFEWAAMYATVSKLDGTGTALTIGAVTAPISVLQGFIFKFYMEGKPNA